MATNVVTDIFERLVLDQYVGPLSEAQAESIKQLLQAKNATQLTEMFSQEPHVSAWSVTQPLTGLNDAQLPMFRQAAVLAYAFTVLARQDSASETYQTFLRDGSIDYTLLMRVCELQNIPLVQASEDALEEGFKSKLLQTHIDRLVDTSPQRSEIKKAIIESGASLAIDELVDKLDITAMYGVTLRGQLAYYSYPYEYKRQQIYLDQLKQQVADSACSPAILAALFQSRSVQEFERVIGLRDVFPTPAYAISGTAQLTFTPEAAQYFATQREEISRLALDKFYEHHLDGIDLTDARSRSVFTKFINFTHGKSPREIAEHIANQRHDSVKQLIVGSGVDATRLPADVLEGLIASYKQKLNDHAGLVEAEGDFESDAEFGGRLEIPRALLTHILATGQRSHAEEGATFESIPASVSGKVQCYHFLTSALVNNAGALARTNDLQDKSSLHNRLVRNANNAAKVLGSVIVTLKNRIQDLADSSDVTQSRQKGRLLTVIEGLKAYQTFMRKFATYHHSQQQAIVATLADSPAATEVNLTLQRTSRGSSYERLISTALESAQAAYANAVFRQNSDWANLLGRIQGMHNGRVDITVRDVNIVPETKALFREIFEDQRQQLLSEGIKLTEPKTANKSGVTVTSYEIELPQEEKVVLEHHEHPAATNKEPELKAMSTSAQSLARVLALMYKVDLQKQGKLDTQGKPVGGFAFNLSDDQIDLSHNSTKPDAAPTAVTADEREQFLDQLDKAFQETFKEVYTGRVATSVIAAKLRTPGMSRDGDDRQRWRRPSERRGAGFFATDSGVSSPGGVTLSTPPPRA